jgi:hypothetical protein
VLRAEVDVVEASGGGRAGGQKCSQELPPPWPNLGEGTNLRMIVLVRRAEPRAGHHKDGTWCDLRKRQMD